MEDASAVKSVSQNDAVKISYEGINPIVFQGELISKVKLSVKNGSQEDGEVNNNKEGIEWRSESC